MAAALELAVDVAVLVITALLTYLSVMARKIHSKLKTHDRVIFGEPEVDRWNGLLGDVYQTKDRLNTVIQNQTSMVRQLQEQDAIRVHDITTPRQTEVRDERYARDGD